MFRIRPGKQHYETMHLAIAPGHWIIVCWATAYHAAERKLDVNHQWEGGCGAFAVETWSQIAGPTAWGHPLPPSRWSQSSHGLEIYTKKQDLQRQPHNFFLGWRRGNKPGRQVKVVLLPRGVEHLLHSWKKSSGVVGTEPPQLFSPMYLHQIQQFQLHWFCRLQLAFAPRIWLAFEKKRDPRPWLG